MAVQHFPNTPLVPLLATRPSQQRLICVQLLTLFRQATPEFLAEAARNFLDAVHDALPGSAKGGFLESQTDSSRQQPSAHTDRWQGIAPVWQSDLHNSPLKSAEAATLFPPEDV